MISPEPYDLARTPLHSGTTLIEASAGTGKTFTLVGLFLRLILDLDFTVREILVVTFTESATGELRGRIRARLADAAAALAAGGKIEDPVLREILRPHLPRREAMQERLDRALSGFDEAPLFTIHGFCQRTLRDRAFESGALFDMELLRDDSRLLQEMADDYWRRHFYEASPLSVQFLIKNKQEPEKLLPLLQQRNRHPQLTILAQPEQRSRTEALDRLSQSFQQAQHLWRSQLTAIRAAFGASSLWAKGEHAKESVVASMWRAATICFEDECRTPDSLAVLKFFATTELEKATRARKTTPRHAFFDRCQETVDCERDYLASLQIDFLDFARQEFPRRKEALKVHTFDDLLTRLHDALQSPSGPALAREVRAKYKAALIDEFQDTDPVQWEIFRQIFGGAGKEYRNESVLGKVGSPNIPALQRSNPPSPPSAAHLFLIGDPKQAIYGFRGADIFTYLDAAATVDYHHTLGCNFRSESGLVRAVNTLFGTLEHPFLFDDIRFHPVQSSAGADRQALTENGQRLPPMHLWFMNCEPGHSDIAREKAEAILPDVVSAEIARLLNGGTRLGAAPLSPRDMAVLVPENRHAVLMQDALRARNIPSVLHTEESVFNSREARELERVLAAMARPSDERLGRAALATALLGWNGPDLDQLARQESEWQRRFEGFLRGHQIWQEEGFTPMYRHWLHDDAVRQRLLTFADGERRLTNILHLGEVLHQATMEHRLSPVGLVRWLSAQIANEEKAVEEHQLRLERDDQAVKLVTIHKSKGMEYPIVFCPFSWKTSTINQRDNEPVFFHERSASEAGGARFFCDLGSREMEIHRQRAFAEKLAENLRLLYVALTRARNRCYFVWGKFHLAGTSAPAWLFHPTPTRTPVASPDETGALLSEEMTARFKHFTDETMLADLQRLAARSLEKDSAPAILVRLLPSAAGPTYQPIGETPEMLAARCFTGRIARNWRILSFSGLAAGRREEVPDYDAAPDAPVTEDPLDEPVASPMGEPQGIFAFPRGTKAGTCLHKIFEVLDFQERDDAALRLLVEKKLGDHGFAPEKFADSICAMICRAVAVPLAGDHPGFLLRHVAKAERLNELEFQFPIARLTPASLQAGFAEAGGASPSFLAQLARLDFEPVGGFVKGFIDLVFRFEGRFYIADWKSNWLGARVEDYGPAAVARVMAEQFYTLQYHLYTVALHRYLQLRLPGYDYEHHFGGVRYLFLRGLDPARPQMGTFSARPTAAWIAELSERWGARELKVTA